MIFKSSRNVNTEVWVKKIRGEGGKDKRGRKEEMERVCVRGRGGGGWPLVEVDGKTAEENKMTS